MDAINAINAINALNHNNQGRSRRVKSYKTRENPFNLCDEEFRYKYRFSKETVRFIVDLVEDDIKKDVRGGGVSADLQVLTAIRCWGRREFQDDAGDLHGLSQPTVSRICCRVAHAIARHAPTFIKMPSNLNEELQIMQDFQNLKGFPGVIGAIDCTHVKIRKPGGDVSQYYINRKGYYSLNVQAICDAKLTIRDIVVRWRGSTHDSRFFSESMIKEKFENRQFRGRLLGDSGYPLLPYLFVPLLHPTNIKEECYTRAQIGTRNTIERCFGVWKQRFQCLLTGMTVSLENVKSVIVALAVLHNIAVSRNDTPPDSEILVAPPQPVQDHPENMQPAALRNYARNILNNFIENNF